MGKRSRVRYEPPVHLRAWREVLGLSRQAVVNKIATVRPDDPPLDQATLAKWENGETAVRVQDLLLLAEVYGVTADRLFYPPDDTATPERMRRAWSVIVGADADAVENWLRTGEDLRRKDALGD